MNSNKSTLFLKVKDHSVSKETFELYRDDTLDMLQTCPQPSVKELPKYYQSDDYISHTDSKRSLFEKAYHIIKNIALKRKIDLINSLQKNKGALLDIGAGTGDFLIAARDNGWKISGTEPSEKARSIGTTKGIAFNIGTENIESQSFDIITMWHVLEHVADRDKQIAELKRLIKPEGHILIAVPNFNSFDAKYYGQFWAAYDVPRHLWHFSKTAIKLLFEKENLELIKILPMKFDAFYVALLSEKYKHGKMNFINALKIGFQSNFKAVKTQQYSSLIYVMRNKN